MSSWTPGALDEFTTVSRDTSPIDAWLPLFVASGVPERSREVSPALLTEGTFRIGARTFAARRVELTCVIVYGVGSDGIPVALSLDVVTSDEVPLHGLLRARFELEILEDPDNPRTVEVRGELVQFTSSE